MAKYLDEAGAEQLNQLLAAKFDTKKDKAISTKTYENIIGNSSNNGQAYNAFYFGSVRPKTFTDTWSVHYRIYVWIESNANYRSMAECLFMGSQSNLASYAIFNNIYSTSYRPVYYHNMWRLLQAGFDAGYGHALGFSLSDSSNRASTSLMRTVKVELLDQVNCSVTLNDTAVLWENWPGNTTTNYNGTAPSTYNFSGNGLQETGDANDSAYVLTTYYDRRVIGAGGVYGYNICTYDSDEKMQGFVNSYSTGTTKTKNTATFRIGAPFYYYNSSTNKASGSYIGDNLLRLTTSTINLQYSTNCGTTLVAQQPVYLVGNPSGSTYTLADTWWTQSLPTTDDGKIYILLGTAYDTKTITWSLYHPIYEYKNGAIRLYQIPVTSSDVTTALGYTPYSAANPNGYTSNTGTITKVQANGTDVASSGTANIPAATTSKYGVTELSSATNSTSEALAATPKAVKAAYDLAASKGTGTITGVSVNGTSVATSGVANITSIPASILSGAIPSAVTATTQTQGDNSTKIATTAYVDAAIDNLPDPMIFKGSLGTGGTITALPVDGSANIGDTYKVITAGTYASKAAKVGDTFICLTKTSSANTWELIPSGDEPSGTVTSVTIKATSPISIDSSAAITSSGTRTLSHANSGVTAGNYKSVTVNATGHVTAGENPTTLAGFGITDAKIVSGTITLGSNTITPLTSHQDISGKEDISNKVTSLSSSSTDTQYPSAKLLYNQLETKAIKDHASKATTFGIGNTDYYGHTRIVDDLNAGSYKAGDVLSSHQGYVLNQAKEAITNKVTSLSSSSTDTQYPSAKLLYDQLALKQGNLTAGTNIDITNNVISEIDQAGVIDLGWDYSPTTLVNYVGKYVRVRTSASYYTPIGGSSTSMGGNDICYVKDSNHLISTQLYKDNDDKIGIVTYTVSASSYLASITTCIYPTVTSLSSSSTDYQNASAKLVYDQLALKQNTLSQGTNITISGNTISATDTKNTAGSTDTSSKIYLIGATSQAANPQTYSDNEVYVTSGAMTAKSYSLGAYATMEYNSTDNCIEFNFS